MYYICFTNNAKINIWEATESKDAMRGELLYLRDTLHIPESKIQVFENPVELKNLFEEM